MRKARHEQDTEKSPRQRNSHRLWWQRWWHVYITHTYIYNRSHVWGIRVLVCEVSVPVCGLLFLASPPSGEATAKDNHQPVKTRIKRPRPALVSDRDEETARMEGALHGRQGQNTRERTAHPRTRERKALSGVRTSSLTLPLRIRFPSSTACSSKHSRFGTLDLLDNCVNDRLHRLHGLRRRLRHEDTTHVLSQRQVRVNGNRTEERHLVHLRQFSSAAL